MQSSRSLITRALTILVFAGSFGAIAAPALSQSTNDKPVAADPTARQQHFREHVQARLERMAQRLQIAPEQESAWAAYRQTVEGLVGTAMPRPPADADAAALTRFRAERAAEHARKLTQLADATATLQQALTAEQREVLNQSVRRPHGQRSHDEHHRGGYGHKGMR